MTEHVLNEGSTEGVNAAWSPPILWRYRDGVFDVSGRTLIMGVLNVTPDSFSDGGHYLRADAAIRHALQMIDDGADVLDVGGESTRPGAVAISADEELERVVPVLESIRARSDIPISVDTSKAVVAEAALRAGASIINDVTGLGDPGMAEVVARYGAGLVLMHMQGEPRTMQVEPWYEDVVAEVAVFLGQRADMAARAGIDRACLVVDPGVGFGKTLDHNVALLRAVGATGAMAGRPVLIGVSRKRMIGTLTGREAPGARGAGSLAAGAFAILQGARILRVHDVKESCDMARVIDKLRLSQAGH